jgi:hypothetical protein
VLADCNRLWSHKKLSEATHRNLSQFLGGTTMKSLQQLMYMGTHGYVVNNKNESLVTDENLKRLNGLPILFIHGSENVVYTPETTDKSYTTLRTAFGPGDYDREVFQGFGHLDCWMGADSAEEIYPRIIAHAQKYAGHEVNANGI